MTTRNINNLTINIPTTPEVEEEIKLLQESPYKREEFKKECEKDNLREKYLVKSKTEKPIR